MQVRNSSPDLPDWLYLLVVASLGIYFVVGGVAWAIIAYDGREIPDSFSTILATIAGGLVGVMKPGGRSPATGDDGARHRSEASPAERPQSQEN